ncbi:MAG: xanthine dehydrogenase family protein molybdopterin-binding subunit [Chloroflexi bacterium]|nr:xanthine dehydrogenase family protein molybdopterin-binding subunit [Chloroflexota bacterium]
MATETKTAKSQYKVIGSRPIRHDGVDKVTGKALYGADIQLAGMLHGKILRSPHPHARIKKVDTSRAEAHPDVWAVATARDIPAPDPVSPKPTLGEMPADNILARDKVLYKGHAVAAVAASSPHVAEEALSLIDVEYEPLPAVTNAEEAMAPGAPILHEHWTTEERPGGTNMGDHELHVHGDLDKGFEAADLVVEREFRTRSIHQGYIEPQNATAWWNQEGRLTLWCSSQGHFGIRDNTARIFGLPVSHIKVVPMEIGGGFGGKLGVYLEPVAAILSKKSGRPVKLTMTRTEVLEATGPTSGSYVRVKIGVTNEGRITAAHGYFVFEAGAFPGGPLGGASAAIFASYDIENVRIDAHDVVDNKPKTAAYRAPGAPMVTYAVETTMDEIAERLGMDPMDLRLLNVAVEGTRRADGAMNRRIGAKETMEAVKAHPHYSAPADGKHRGRGVGMGFCRNNSGMSCVVANVLSDGTVSLIEGSVDIGGTRVAVAQQLAEVLGVPVEDVNPQIADTDTIGYTSNTGGSGVAFKTGWAAYEAAHDVMRQLVQRAALVWETEEDQVEYADGVLSHKADPELRLTFKQIASMLPETGGPVVGRANINPGGSGGSYSANIVDVEVDAETGKVDILRYTAFQDAGTAIHPSYVEGQIQGGTSQGVGWALNEEYFMSEDGKMLNSSFLDYRMPTSLDLPMIDAVVVEVPNPGHPFGVRGVGEANIVPPLAALANAIYDAVGVRMHQLPMTPASIAKAMKGKKPE